MNELHQILLNVALAVVMLAIWSGLNNRDKTVALLVFVLAVLLETIV